MTVGGLTSLGSNITLRALQMKWLMVLVALTGLAQPERPAPLADQPRWIVVASRQLEDALLPLCEQRRQQGYDVVVVNIEDIGAEDIGAEGDPARAAALQARLRELFVESPGPDFVLLAGDMFRVDPEDEDWPRVPAAVGTSGRMAGLPTDHAYGCSGDNRVPDVAVGRFPAGSRRELQLMVDKTLAFESQSGTTVDAPWLWNNRINMIVGHPGGSSPLEKSMSEAFVNSAINEAFQRIHPQWQVESLVHTRGSSFYVNQNQLHETTRGLFNDTPELFTIFLGHSNAAGFASTNGVFFGRHDWQDLESRHPAGVLFSTGCFGSQILGLGGQGYAQASLRASSGTVAAIGATGLSYAAAGKWAIDGFLQCVEGDQPPAVLADFWLASINGIATSPMTDEVFLALDQADGSRGATSMAEQRDEHLEMWILLGDPALRIPVQLPEIPLRADWQNNAGDQVMEISSPTNPAWNEASAILIIERPLESSADNLERVRRRRELQQLDIVQENWHKANDFEIAREETSFTDNGLQATISLPADLPYDELIVRVIAQPRNQTITGVARATKSD